MDLAYIAHSERCALLLDAGGICRWVVPKVEEEDALLVAARRCVGAQFVASLDPAEPGYLATEPRVGTSLLFAIIDDGRVALVRFGPLLSFDKLDAQSARSLTGASALAAESSPVLEDAPPEIPPPAPTLSSVEKLPPTLARVPDLDDVLASFSSEPLEDAEDADVLDDEDDEDDEDDLVTLSRPAPAPETNQANAEESKLEPEPVKAAGDERMPMPLVCQPSPDLEALFERLAKGAPLEPSVTTSAPLQITELDPKPPGAGDSELDVSTTAFLRSDGPLGAEIEDETIPESRQPSLRPSGFVMRGGLTAPVDAEEASDDTTRPFARAAGGIVPR